MYQCEFDGCENERLAKGLCSAHYKQLRRNKELAPLRTKKKAYKPCENGVCKNDSYARGLCKSCYECKRLRKGRKKYERRKLPDAARDSSEA